MCLSKRAIVWSPLAIFFYFVCNFQKLWAYVQKVNCGFYDRQAALNIWSPKCQGAFQFWFDMAKLSWAAWVFLEVVLRLVWISTVCWTYVGMVFIVRHVHNTFGHGQKSKPRQSLQPSATSAEAPTMAATVCSKHKTFVCPLYLQEPFGREKEERNGF